MAKLLMNLRNVPDDEADAVRALLDARGVAFYETRPSVFGVSFGGIWVKEDAAFADAWRALDEYERERSARVRAAYAEAKRAGTAPTFVGMLREEPMRVLLSLLAILLALAVVALPALLLRG